jgi:hypothetical protein
MSKSKAVMTVFVLLEIVALLGSWLSARTPFIWFFIPLSFIVPVIFCFRYSNKRILMLLLVLLFIAQHMPYLGPQYSYAEPWLSDSWGDYATAALIQDSSSWTPGMNSSLYRVGAYSLYPAVHIIGVVCSDIVGVSINDAVRLSLPVCESAVVALVLFFLLTQILKNEKLAALSTIIFATNYWYAYFDSTFDREVCAFPLILLSILSCYLYLKKSDRRMAIITVLSTTTVVIAHFVASLVLIFLLLGLFFYFKRKPLLYFYVAVVPVLWALYVTSWGYPFSTLNALYNIIAGSLFIRSDVQSIPMVGSPAPLLTLTYLGYVSLMCLFLVGLSKFKSQSSTTKIIVLGGLLLFMLSGLTRLFAGGWGSGLFPRILTYSYLGISVGVAIGIFSFFKSSRRIGWRISIPILLILFMVFGSVAQQAYIAFPAVADVPNSPSVYSASIWVKTYSYPGTLLAFRGEEYVVTVKSLARQDAISLYANINTFLWDNSTELQQANYHGLFLLDPKLNYNRPVDLVFCSDDVQLGYG